MTLMLDPTLVKPADYYEWKSGFLGLSIGNVEFGCGHCHKHNQRRKATTYTSASFLAGGCEFCGKLNIFRVPGTTKRYVTIEFN